MCNRPQLKEASAGTGAREAVFYANDIVPCATDCLIAEFEKLCQGVSVDDKWERQPQQQQQQQQ